MSKRQQQTTTRLPADAMSMFIYLDLSDLKPFGKKGCKINYINFQGKKLRLQMGTYDDPVTFPFGISEPYDNENNQQGGNQYQAYQQNFQHQQAGYGFSQQQPMSYAQQPQAGQGWNNPMGPQPSPGSAQATSTSKKTIRIQFKEDSVEYKMLEQFDKDILTLCSKNWPRWFKEEKTVEQLVERYSRCLKLKDLDGNPVPAGFGTKLDLDEVDVEVYAGDDSNDTDENGKPTRIVYPGTVKDVTKRSGGKAVVEPMGIWHLGGKFGVTFRTKRISVFANLTNDDDGFADNDETVELRARPADFVVRGTSELDDHDVPNVPNDIYSAGQKRSAEQAGIAAGNAQFNPRVPPQPAPASFEPQQFSQPNTPTQNISPGQAIMPPLAR